MVAFADIVKFSWGFLKIIGYIITTYILLLLIGFFIDRTIGLHKSLIPIKKSVVSINIGIIKKLTPVAKKVAEKVNPEDLEVVSNDKENNIVNILYNNKVPIMIGIVLCILFFVIVLVFKK